MPRLSKTSISNWVQDLTGSIFLKGLWVSLGLCALFLVLFFGSFAYFIEPLYQNDTQEANLTEDFPFILEQIQWYARNKFRQLGGSKDFVASLDNSSALDTISSYKDLVISSPTIQYKSQRDMETSPMEVCKVLVVGHQRSQKALITEAWWLQLNKDAKTAS